MLCANAVQYELRGLVLVLSIKRAGNFGGNGGTARDGTSIVDVQMLFSYLEGFPV